MFVCPHCQSENPLQNRFCQQCGKALRELQAIVLPIDGPSDFSAKETAPVNSTDAASSLATAVATVTTLLTPKIASKAKSAISSDSRPMPINPSAVLSPF
jgi:hypothetical protein